MVSIIFRKKKKQTTLPQTIGVCGMIHNIGTTNLGLATANYLANKCFEATAYLEVNATNEIYQLNPKQTTGQFTYMGIDFFPEVTLRQLPELLQMKYSCFVAWKLVLKIWDCTLLCRIILSHRPFHSY